MILMCRIAKSILVSGKKLVKGSVFFVLKGLLVCFREGSMELNRPRRIDIVKHKCMDMESIPIVK